MPTASTRFRTRPLHARFGLAIEVGDLPARSAATIGEIARLAGAAGLVLIRGAALDAAALGAFAARFGTLQALSRPDGESPGIYRLSNLREDGSVRPPDDAARLRHEANKLWHVDSSFMAPGASLSFMQAAVVPEGGKDTLLCDTRVAWEALDKRRQAELLPLVALHAMDHSWRLTGLTLPGMTSGPPVARRLVRTHQPSGRRALVIPSHVQEIVGYDERRGRALLLSLTTVATAPERVYRHRWRAGDLLVWDNRCMLHRASRRGAEDQPREMLTCRLVDTFDDGLAPAAS